MDVRSHVSTPRIRTARVRGCDQPQKLRRPPISTSAGAVFAAADEVLGLRERRGGEASALPLRDLGRHRACGGLHLPAQRDHVEIAFDFHVLEADDAVAGDGALQAYVVGQADGQRTDGKAA